MLRRASAAVVVALAATQIARAQAPELRIERDGRAPVTMTLERLQKLPTDTLSLSNHGAPPVRYRVVKLLDVMAAAGSPIDSLRLGHAGWIVVALAADGYTAVFSAGEIEPKLGPTRAYVAFARDGEPLAVSEAPFQFIVPTDSHGTRSARQVTTVRILDPLKPATR